MNLTSKEIKNKFLSFFEKNDHLLISSASIVPKNDPTLLFINSGMAPIKKYFTGEDIPACPRLCNMQPCIRTIDIDEIGDKHHLTSFQMLGSWSINDYFKEKAIFLAFEFLTKYLNIPKEKLYATVFAGDKNIGLDADEESIAYWEKVGMPRDHIITCSIEDNFWGPTSEIGPCGPCTEVFYDTGKGIKYEAGSVFDTKERYIEIWNAGVFMQLNKNEDATFSKLSFMSVDTGAGLERLAMVLNGYSSVYETDMLAPIKNYIENSINNSNKSINEKNLRILTDHFRTVSLILSENVIPSNEGRGYIPRKLIRKCVMLIKRSGIANFDYEGTLKFVINKYSELYPDFVSKEKIIISEFNKERVQFEKVLIEGLKKLDDIKEKSTVISGDEAFELVTTYGVPFDIINEYALDSGLKLDEQAFIDKMNYHKQISKKSNSETKGDSNIDLTLIGDYSPSEFIGYDMYKCKANILGIVVNSEEFINDFDIKLKAGDKILLILDSTCMYAESGGQDSDKGFVTNNNGVKIVIDDVKKTKKGIFVHIGHVEQGGVISNPKVYVETDALARKNLSNNHSCVHLLHSALRKIFGNDVHQAGSKVLEHSLRFDFNYDKQISEDEILKIESLVNSYIRENLTKKTEIKSLSEAIKEGAIALFESKYSNNVRVVSFGNVSKELCGGTHTSETGNIGLFLIKSTESIGKGIKRITAITGNDALIYAQEQRHTLKEICSILKVRQDNINEKILEISSKNFNKKSINSENLTFDEIKFVETKNKIKFGYVAKDEYYKTFTDNSINMADKIGGVFACICGSDRKRLILAVSSSSQDKIHANDLLAKVIEEVGGRGGGKHRIASGGTEADVSSIIKSLSNNL